MGVANIAQASNMMLERVLPDLPTYWGVEDSLVTYIKPGKAFKVSDKAMRIPNKAARGGISGGMNLDGGGFLRGTGTLFKQFLVTTVGAQHVRELTTKAIDATKGDEQALEKLLRHETAQAVPEFKCFLDRALQVDNSGVMAILNTVVNAPTYSVKGGPSGQSGNPWGAQLLSENQLYDVYDSTLAVLRQAGAALVQDGGVDYPNQTVTFTASIPGAVIGDKLVTVNWANAALAGLPTFISDSTSGSVQGLLRSLPYCQARSVDAGNGPLSLDYIRQLRNAIKIRKGVDKWKSITPYAPPVQLHAYEQLAQANIEINKGSAQDETDLLFDNLRISGKKILEDSNADPTKIQYLERNAFGWAEMTPITMHESDGMTIFPIYQTSGPGAGAPSAQHWFALKWQGQLFCRDITNMGFIKNLAVIAGYVGA